MFQEDLYRRLASQSHNTKRKIDTSIPWFPKQRPKVVQKDEYKFFVLPPNKMISLLKKQQMSFIYTDEQIRQYIKTHSLKHIVYHGIEQKPAETRLHMQTSIASPKLKMHPLRKRDTFIKLSSPATDRQSVKRPMPREQRKIIQYNETSRETGPTQIYSSSLHQPGEITISPIRQTRTVINEVPQSILPYPMRTKKQLKNILIRSLRKIKALGLTPHYVMTHKVFSKKPYEKINSKEFIHAAKKNDLETITQLLQINRFLVFDFDFYNMTALHWACKKGNEPLVRLLLDHHADADGVDVLNRTPLSLALQENYLNICLLLLQRGAYPWSTTVTDLKQFSSKNSRAKALLTQARRLDIMQNWTMQSYIQLI